MSFKLVVPTAFTPTFLAAIAPYPVRALYGGLSEAGGFRARRWLPPVAPEQAAQHIEEAHRRGVSFLYPLNSLCLGNREFTGEWQRWFVDHLAWLEEVGARGVIVASPYIAELVRSRAPGLELHISTIAGVDSAAKALFYRELGAHSIYLPEYLNRDFRTLASLRRSLDCELVITVNLGCLMDCPMRSYHTAFISHSAESLERGCYIDYSLLKCTLLRALNPAELIKGTWIRPEDLHYYEDLGFTVFKISGRTQGDDWVLRAVDAYAQRRHDGDLNDLVEGYDLLEPFGPLPLRVDNRALEGFLDLFVQGKECRWGCGDCAYCDHWAGRAVSTRGSVKPYQEALEGALRRYTSGGFRAPLAHPGYGALRAWT